jgi:Flp pilus assembly protein TadD
MIYYDLGRYDLAVENLREASLEDPANLEIRTYLAQAETRAAEEPSSIAYYEKLVERDPASPEYNLDLAIALYLTGDYDRALMVFQKAYRLSPTNGAILFYRGLIKLKLGAVQEAVEDIRRARDLEPKLGQAAMFVEAFGVYKLGEREDAKDLFQEVINANPTTDYAAQAHEYLESMVVKRFSARVTTGAEYDTNVPLEGDENTFNVPLDLADKYQFRFPVSALLDYRFLDIGRWSIGARYGLYASFHDEDGDLNVISNQPELYAVYRSSQWYFRPFYFFDSTLLDEERYSDTHAVGGQLMFYAPRNLAPELYFRWQNREYHFPTFEDADPDSNNFRGEFNQYLFIRDGLGYVRGGFGMETNRADGRNQDYTSLLLLTGLRYPLPWETMFTFDFEFQRRGYLHTHTVFGKERDDLRYRFAWEISKYLGRGFDLRGRFVHIRNDSDIGDFDYDRQIYSLLLSWSY